MLHTRIAQFISRLTGRQHASEARLDQLEGRMMQLEAMRLQWDSHLPQLINQIDRLVELDKAQAEIQPHLDNLGASTAKLKDGQHNLAKAIQDIWQRIEVYRTEALLEVRYGKKDPGQAARQLKKKSPAALVNKTDLKINLGCGHVPLAGYINVDARPLPGVDIVADVSDMPLAAESVKNLFSSHLLEHFPQEELKRRLLPYWFGLLAPGGEFRAIVPDGEAMLKGAGDGTYAFEDLRQVLFGGQDYTGDFHFNLFTPNSMQSVLETAGFEKVVFHATSRRNGQCFEFEVSAKKPLIKAVETKRKRPAK